ncbi:MULTISPECIES: DUF1254 domain-containing protein [Kitasatospora]|uniref:DUF1254 domain-containing protein n=1 Tax=Kitasatospora setae (strain ATCC 33774 / DSM 43861 / JCM 3304 / KCC A-0304 / NBRC 14216 / KM-6054) TaxID=452652 RepID=E4NDF5_KITSK|nr:MULTISPECIES: DUF1254 domain-containing protein [Kitasatospora]BAJ29236.1 hypothetical protein KSE_34290 [Kitasatospora setae KM-6054]
MADATPEMLAAEAHVYGSPLVAGLVAVDGIVRHGLGSIGPTPWNTFGHAAELGDASSHFVSVNNDTLYSVAPLDLSAGPLLLHVPDTGGAYDVLQFVDAWTNNFAYVGRRSSGTAEQSWLVAPPGWRGTAPEGVPVISSPTAVAVILGRNYCAGPDDIPRVRELQGQLTLTPVDGGAATGLPEPDPGVPGDLLFLERLRLWAAAFPPAAADVEFQRRFAPIGLHDQGRSPYLDGPPEWAAALAKGLAAGRERVEAATAGADDATGEWAANLHLFDYNLDHLGPGTRDEPQWKIADRRSAYLSRAVAARAGLWGNHAYEAAYATTYHDADGVELTGAHAYTLRFERTPPVGAFWSVTMYGTPEYLLVANEIDRYSIGDRTPGLVYGEDGSLTLYLQRERPTDAAEFANWLPAPEGGFRPMVRMYQPKDEVLDGSYRLPPIRLR